MAIFGNKKTEDKEKKAAKPASSKVKAAAGKKEEAAKPSMKELYGSGAAAVETKKGAAETGKPEAKKDLIHFSAYRIIKRPLITEKASHLGAQNKYFFAVDVKANKVEVAKAIAEVYGVKPVKVNIINSDGKIVRRGRTTGKRKDWKKAIVTLPEGKTIEIYEGI